MLEPSKKAIIRVIESQDSIVEQDKLGPKSDSSLMR